MPKLLPFRHKTPPQPKSTFFKTYNIMIPEDTKKPENQTFLSKIMPALVWCPSEAEDIVLKFQQCEFEILSDPDFTKFVEANSSRWLAAMHKHDQEYRHLYQCMMVLKSLYKRRVIRYQHYSQEYILCGRINLAWAKLCDTFDPYVLRYYTETESGLKDPSRPAQIAELEKRVAATAKMRNDCQEIGIPQKSRDPRMNYGGW